MESKSQRKNKAFALLELIIAIAILAGGLVTVLEALSFCARVTGLSCDMINAAFLAEDKLQELDYKEKQGLISKEPSAAEDKKDKFAYKYTLNFDRDLNLYKLNWEVNWKRANREEELNLNTYLRQ